MLTFILTVLNELLFFIPVYVNCEHHLSNTNFICFLKIHKMRTIDKNEPHAAT